MTDCLSKPNHSLTQSLTDFYILSSLTFNRKIWIILNYPFKVSSYCSVYIGTCSDILSCNWKLIESRSDFSSGFEQTMGDSGDPIVYIIGHGMDLKATKCGKLTEEKLAAGRHTHSRLSLLPMKLIAPSCLKQIFNKKPTIMKCRVFITLK